MRIMTPVPFRIHWYSIGLPCMACSACCFFYNNPWSNHPESDYWLQLKLCWFCSINCDGNYSIRPTEKHSFNSNFIFSILLYAGAALSITPCQCPWMTLEVTFDVWMSETFLHPLPRKMRGEDVRKNCSKEDSDCMSEDMCLVTF